MEINRWVKSSSSTNNGQCVEVKRLALGDTLVRDDKLGEQSPVLRFGVGEWAAFIVAVKAGEFDGDMSPLEWAAASHLHGHSVHPTSQDIAVDPHNVKSLSETTPLT